MSNPHDPRNATTMKAQSATERLANFVMALKHDPYGFAASMYNWGQGDLEGSKGPRAWQKAVLKEIGAHLQNPLTRHTPFMKAVASGRGVGKSSLIGMVCAWAMSTCIDCRIVITANTERQLLNKTMPEISKWFRNSINNHWFKATAMQIYAVAKGHEKTWIVEACPWSETNTEAFQGLHNMGKRIVIVYDEASGIHDKVWEVTEGVLTDANTEIIWLAFANPTRNTGRFRECFTKFANMWRPQHLDSRTVEGTNKDLFDQWAKLWGDDSDFFRVHVKGEFPRASDNQFIPGDIVEAAKRREPESHLHDPLVLGVDIARFGNDLTVLAPRRGRDARSIPWVFMRGADTMQIAAKVNQMQMEHRFDAIFIDGGGVGGGVVDRLRQLKTPNVFEVQFGAAADKMASGDAQGTQISYANKRAEMYGGLRDWLRRGGCIPDDKDLIAALTGLEYGYRDKTGDLLLERKADAKKRLGEDAGGFDKSDAIALTFSYDVHPSDHSQPFNNRNQTSTHTADYNPLSPDYVNSMWR